MKKLSTVVVCCMGFLMFAGCQGQAGRGGIAAEANDAGPFPDSLAGRWESTTGVWELVFEPNGTISSIVYGFGGYTIKAGQTTNDKTKGGGKAIFQPGPWSTRYSPRTRELTVWIAMDNIYFEMGENLLEGTRTDMFTGKVSEDGKVWQADWFSYPDLTAHASQVKRLTVTEEQSFAGTLEFRKVKTEPNVPADSNKADSNLPH
ncbi:MAG: hypothetical protein ABSG82_04375 [Sedimentisphaerales bacterium]|jgi:hypothetical protein